MNRIFGMVSTASSRDYTPIALKTFFAHTPRREGDRFILIDNDHSLDIATLKSSFPPVEILVHDKAHSFAENANITLAEARKSCADFFFLNNDIAFTPGWITQLETPFPSITLPLCNTDLQLQGETFTAQKAMDLSDYLGHEDEVAALATDHARKGLGLKPVLSVPYFCVRIHPEVYGVVGDFDASFCPGGGEDSDYSLRAALQGYPVMLACASWVLHFVGKSTWRGGESKEQTAQRNRAYLEAFKRKWGEPLSKLVIGRDPSPLQRHPEFKALFDEASFRRLVARLYPSRLPEGLLWQPKLATSGASTGVSDPGYRVEPEASVTPDPQLLYEAMEYAADRRHVSSWVLSADSSVRLRQTGSGAGLEDRMPASLNPLPKGAAKPFFSSANALPISLCMIVKNEAINLGSCLRSVRGLVSEVIIVDTGSSDGTQDLVRAYGAQLIQTTWENDFSKARNLGLDAATQKWILVLDADEGFLEPDKAALRDLLQRNKEPAAGFALQQNSSSDGGRTGILVSIVRLFPNRPDVRYEWPVHEQPVTSLERVGLPIHKVPISILHTGYADTERNVEKQRRNLAILRVQVEKGAEGGALTHFLMASSLVDLGEYGSALEAFAECRKRSQAGSELALGSEVGTAICLAMLERHEEVLSLMPTEPSPNWHPKLFSLRGECLAALGRKDEALSWYEGVLGCNPGAYIPPCNVASEKSSALMWLGGYWRDKGRPALGVAILRKALECRQTGTDFRPEMLVALYRA